jgi:DNA integrity scanning protein DisA with diadenylate cyclase activity
MDCVVDSAKRMADDMNATFLHVITNDAQIIDSVTKKLPDIPILVATSDKKLAKALRDREMSVKKLSRNPLKGLNILAQAKELLLSAWGEGVLSIDDRVLCIISTDIQALLFFDVQDMGIASIKEKVMDRIPLDVLEAVFNVATQIAREGREGKPAGALFVLGDSENVMKNSRALIINPFKGHEKNGCKILEDENLTTIKEFALLDGAMIIDGDGCAIAAGRYIVGVDWDLYLQGGLGGRHLAGASITKTTKAVSIVVSSTGTIRAYKDGEEIYRTGVS